MERRFLIALAASVTVHSVLMFSAFVDVPAKEKSGKVLTAIIVNSSTREKPAKADHIAQANLAGGGEESGRRSDVASPFKYSPKTSVKSQISVEDVATDEKDRLEALERETTKLLALIGKGVAGGVAGLKNAKSPTLENERDALDIAASVERRLADYAARPRKKFIGVKAEESAFAVWTESWQRRVERTGNAMSPSMSEALRGGGRLIATVDIRMDGTVGGFRIEKTSGKAALDKAAEEILMRASPFKEFSSAMRKTADSVHITRTWVFSEKTGLDVRKME